MSNPPSLPSFNKPPVVETVLGVEFAPIARWSIPHFGLFWSELRSEYPGHEVQAPIESVPERFGVERSKPQGVRIELLHQPRVRCWFHDVSETRLIQVQHDRFVHNWRKRPPEPYPRYPAIRQRFETEWQRFCAFVDREGLGRPRVTQCEVTYVNEIEQGDAWSSLADLNKVVTFWNKYQTDRLDEPEGILTRTAHVLPKLKARFYVELQKAIRNSDLKDILQLSLTVRGQPPSGSNSDVLTWMDQAREAIVFTFADLTTARMHEIWERRS